MLQKVEFFLRFFATFSDVKSFAAQIYVFHLQTKQTYDHLFENGY